MREVELHELAEAIRDEAWVDLLVVETGLAQRVKPLSLRIRREGEDVEVVQAWPEDGLVNHTNHTFDVSDLLLLRPTQVELLDVAPLRSPTPEPEGSPVKDGGQAASLCAVIVEVICERTGAIPTRVMEGGNTKREFLYERKEAMWCLMEMTDLKPEVVAMEVFGYRSLMPLTTIRYRVEALAQQHPYVTQDDRDFKKWACDTIAKVDARVGQRFRRSESAQPRWWPSLLYGGLRGAR